MRLNRTANPIGRVFFAALLVCALGASSSLAQNGRPDPQKPSPSAGGSNASATQPASVDAAKTGNNNSTRPVRNRQPKEGKVVLAFNDVPVDEIIPFIVESTGKVVMPINLVALKAKKITLMNDEPVDRAAALDLLITALRLNGIGVIESPEVVILDLIENIRTKGLVTVLIAGDDVMSREDLGTFIVKIYRLKEASADNVGEKLQENLPDYATLSIDTNSNQIILYGDVGLAQHMQRLINELDHNHVVVKTETYRLQYADAQAVADQVYELFEDTQSTTGQPGQARPPTGARGGRNAARPAPGGATVSPTPAGVGGPGPTVQLRVSVNVQQNAVTVSAEPYKIDAIGKLIKDEWDLPRPDDTAKVYVLEYTDPLKVQELLQNLLGTGGGGSRSQGGNRGGGGTRGAGGGVSGATAGAAISEVIGDIYRIEAYPDQNSLVVLSKTTKALDYLDSIIAAIDQPSNVGLPQIVELKHANAVNLADELNVLLAEAGTGGSLVRPGEGLNAQGPGGFSGSGSTSGTNTGTSGGTSNAGGLQSGAGSAGGGTIEFPWQRGRQRDDQAEPSSLIGKVRIVPVIRQNALAILAPVAQRHAVVELIKDFDKPGRQVMISAIIAEVTLTDDFAFGLKFSSSGLTPSNPENAVSGTLGFTGTQNNIFSNLFDTSVLDVNADINVLLQALSKKTNVRVIQKPRIFTADNQEAAFFDGQQIPFITNSVVNSNVTGSVTQSFNYKDVGVLLNVRPHITVQRDVDMEIKLALSAVVPGQTLFGGAILDLRQTTTKVIVKNAQTIVLSGLLKDVDSKVKTGLPFLSDIPLLGELFKTHENSKSTKELVAFITPIVVDNPTENDTNFNSQERENLQKLARPLKEQAKERARLKEKIVKPDTNMQEPAAPPADENDNRKEQPEESDKQSPEVLNPTDDPPDDVPPVDIDTVKGKPGTR